MNQKSIFAASQRAAKMVEQDRPVLEFAQSPEQRVRDRLRKMGITESNINDYMSSYNLIIEVRKQLGIKD